jgi:hypothetical protein
MPVETFEADRELVMKAPSPVPIPWAPLFVTMHASMIAFSPRMMPASPHRHRHPGDAVV